jgi:hypothetical protein
VVAHVLDTIRAGRGHVVSITPKRRTLEDIFVETVTERIGRTPTNDDGSSSNGNGSASANGGAKIVPSPLLPPKPPLLEARRRTDEHHRRYRPNHDRRGPSPPHPERISVRRAGNDRPDVRFFDLFRPRRADARAGNGLGIISLAGLFISIILAINLIPTEIEKRTIYTILSKPVRRHEFLLGKYFGAIGTV